MPNLPFWPSGSDDEAANDTDGAQLDEFLDAAAAGMPGDATAHGAGVAEILRSAAAAAEPAELAGESAAIAAFRRRSFARGKAALLGGTATLSTRLTRRAAACLAAGAVTLTGAATAAYACVLPAPIQSFAHHTIAAPPPAGAHPVGLNADHRDPTATPSPTHSASASGSTSASGSASASSKVSPAPNSTDLSNRIQQLRQLAASGLCSDYAAASKAGAVLDPHELAALTRLAGGAAAISRYCAKIPVQPQPACLAGPHATLVPSSGISKPGEGWWSRCGCSPAETSSAETRADGNPHELCDAILAAPDNTGHHPGKGAKPLPNTTPHAAPSPQKSGPAGQPQHPGHGPFPWVNGHGFGIGAPGKSHQHSGTASPGSSRFGSSGSGSSGSDSSGSGSSHVHATG